MASARDILGKESYVYVAKAALEDLSQGLQTGSPVGSFSSAVYDTAWLARIFTRGNEPAWLFPQCFQYLLETQNNLGGWPSEGSETNDILNTMAAIIAFRDHQMRASIVRAPLPTDFSSRLLKAERHLENILRRWDISSTTHVGFEILVPSMIEVLEGAGERLHFSGRQALMSLYKQKMISIQLDVLYTNRKTTLLHSLEAFVGKIDFDRVTHHIDKYGSIMASPAATAAYLMCSSTWNETAERYLHHVVMHGSGKGGGGVPSAFPTSTFETSWIVSTLMKTSVASMLLNQSCINTIRCYLQSQLDSHQGVVGWDSDVLADADDTAKTILSLNLLNVATSPAAMVTEFRVNKHFQTYKYERNASLSTNCNVLDALLHAPDPAEYTSQIVELAQFICDAYFSGSIRDKWNASEYYSTMLICQVLVRLLQAWDSGILNSLPEDLILFQVPIILLQIPIRSMQAQRSDGSWYTGKRASSSPSPQVSAYAVLSLKTVQFLPWVNAFRIRVEQAIERGSAYIMAHLNSSFVHEPIWIEKVTYALPPVARAYCAAALCPVQPHTWNERIRQIPIIPSHKVQHLARFFSQLPLFSEDEIWTLEADVTLGYLYQPKLLHASSLIFPQSRDVTYYKYLEYIPFTWISTNRKNHYPLTNNQIWETMMIAVLDYQLDEFMETAFDHGDKDGNIRAVRLLVRELCMLAPEIPPGNDQPSSTQGNTTMSSQETDQGGIPDSHHRGYNNASTSDHIYDVNSSPDTKNRRNSAVLQHIESVLRRFTSHIFQHDATIRAPFYTRKSLHSELATCILAHIDHVEDNILFATEQNSQLTNRSPSKPTQVRAFGSPRRTYYSWVNTTGANDTHAPFTFQFFACLVAPVVGEPLFRGVRQHYLSSATSRHLSNLCRQYNDYGSVARDEAENNLNSLNFPEFHENSTQEQGGVCGGVKDKNAMKQDLYFIAQYERQCLNHAMEALEAEIRPTRQGDWKLKALKVFIDTVDLYGQMYIAKDLTPRVR
ncbi:hypothetical protein O1611_g1462 [Lasiodiplodia mahajangana]|uniref:Uncharacterized protein n=1 Tax=Lasiodiplodia mahajangana TaxID=1108764 RepID=A0ACC2JXL8_9PEZI|nr:hypothetical protein O1611_g1462 [Lasiodiplodia mahajangana]